MKKTEAINTIRTAIVSNNRALYKALLIIYENQTSEEKSAQTTIEDNEVGFSGVDARLLSSFAAYLQRWGDLTERQLVHARKKMPKYARQILDLSLAKGIWKNEGREYYLTKSV